MLLALMLKEFGNPCAWYFVIFLLDTILGTLANWGGVVLTTYIAHRCFGSDKLDSGHYGNPPQWSIWGLQLSVWLGIIVVNKILIFFSFVWRTLVSE
jgi:hypothetical protein